MNELVPNRSVADIKNLLRSCRALLPPHIVRMQEMTEEAILSLYDIAEIFDNTSPKNLRQLCDGYVLATLFYQPSTRTRLNFESAGQRLGMSIIGFSDPRSTRAGDYYQESLEDVVRFTSYICDIVALRHFETGAAERAASTSVVPLINAGDGYNQHPTQALGDIWTMTRCLGSVKGRTIGLLGDASIRSLKAITYGLCTLKVGCIAYLLPPEKLFPEELAACCSANNIQTIFVSNVRDLLEMSDLVETIGVNHPDHSSSYDPSSTRHPTPECFRVTRETLESLHRSPPFILHPGPRTDEVSPDCDDMPQAMYFAQARNGMLTRMALLAALLA